MIESGTCDPLCSVDETSSQDFEETYQPKTDFLKALAIFAAAITGAVAINHSWVAANQVHQSHWLYLWHSKCVHLKKMFLIMVYSYLC